MAEKFQHWGIVELMGHQRAAGRLSEEVIAGANLLRVDVPDGESFRTAYYGPNAIYALHVTDEAAARAAAQGAGSRPPFAWELESRLPRLPRESTSAEIVDDDPFGIGDEEGG